MNKTFAVIISLFAFISFSYARYLQDVMSDDEILSKYNGLSVGIESAKNKKEAVELYEKAGKIFFAKGAYDAASNAYNMLLGLKPSKKKKAEYYINLGDMEAAKKSYSSSLDYYKSALALYKKNNEIKKKIGDILLESNLYSLAEQNFKDILASDKNSDYAKRNLGDIYYSQKKYSKALEYYEGIKISYYDKELIANMAACYKSLGRLDKAVSLADDFINTNPGSDMYLLSGLLYSATGKFEKAKEQYLTAVKFDEKNFYAYMNLAAIYFDEGDIQKSEEMLNNANQINSYTAAVDIMYARVAYKKGRLYDARRHAANAVLKSKTPFLKQQSQRMLDYFNDKK
ncbi:MAG: tetratricopeptide repeat protein [Endomicrobia bacterium]|nr:tetratricopeptide repeat protein [Endomicrobiia bacterium]